MKYVVAMAALPDKDARENTLKRTCFAVKEYFQAWNAIGVQACIRGMRVTFKLKIK